MKTNAFSRPLGMWLLAAAAAGTWQLASAQQPLAQASVQTLLDALDAPISRSFTITTPPDVKSNLCANKAPAGTPGSAGSRNLEVVAYGGDTTPGVNLDVQFGNNSDKLSAGDRTLLDNLATALNDVRLKGSTFALAGHTDSKGPADINLVLSCARSLAVRQYLVGKGVAANRLTAYGFGSQRPLAGTAATAQQSRRVEVRTAP